MSDEPALEITELSVVYRRFAALSQVNLTVARGEMLAVLGPSGAGKSTLLNAIAGLAAPTRGRITLAGNLVATAHSTVPPERRNVGVVFQNYALWPHLTARATVAYPLRRAGLSRAASELAATELLQRLGIEALADRRPAELSGGEQQRVGLARALARNPALYLLDEPTAHLDTQLRAAFQAELRRRQLGSGAAAVCATHDPGEALAIADRIALIIAGRVVQTGTATEVYEQPVSVEAARLTGAVSVLRSPTSSDHQLLIRPEWTNTSTQFSGRIKAIWFRGPYTDYLIGMGIDDILVRRPGPPQHRCDEQLAWGLDRVWTVPVRPGRQPSAVTAPG